MGLGSLRRAICSLAFVSASSIRASMASRGAWGGPYSGLKSDTVPLAKALQASLVASTEQSSSAST